MLQVGLVHVSLAELWFARSSLESSRALDAAEKAFQAARSPFWLTRVAALREDVLNQLGLRTG